MVVHPQRVQEENGEEWMRENFVGTGPFQVDEWIRDNRAVFTKSGHHWEFDPAPVSGLITGKLGATVQLAIAGLGLRADNRRPLGVLSATRRGGPLDYLGNDTCGLMCAHGRAASNAADAANTVSSSPGLPMMCSPTGIPSESNPHGMLAAVNPIVLIG